MTLKQAFEYLASECGVGMKNPFIALRNLVEGFSKVADEVDPIPTGDFVKKSGDTMTGPLVVEDGITATKFSYEEPALGGTINLVATPSTADVDVQIPNKNGTLVLTSTVYNYTLSEKKVGSWLGEDLYMIVFSGTTPASMSTGAEIGSIDNLKHLVFASGTIERSTGRQDILPADEQAIFYNDGKMYIYSENAAHTSRPFTVIVQYTKNAV